jgi:starch synthase
MRRVLYATSEVFPLIKTGGLADVSGSLPQALFNIKEDVRIIMPAYAEVMDQITRYVCMARIKMPAGEVRILMTQLPESHVKVWLVDFPGYFDRPGNPYLAKDGKPWEDNANRFALFCEVVVEIAMQRTKLKWKPDIVHCNDWQTGLIPVLLAAEDNAPPTLFTIHNLAYQGLFPYSTFTELGLDESLWNPESLEFHQQLSFIKGGLVYADKINTVSPRYAEEIQTEKFGFGLEGLLRHRSQHLSGILNGINMELWDPETDEHLVSTYSIRQLNKKQLNKHALQSLFGLPENDQIMLGFIGRLVPQKGIDIILQAIHQLMQLPVQLVFLGTGEYEFQQSLLYFAEEYPERIAVTIGYDETIAHQIEAGADVFLMPSRFEPCGLNQMYSLRYGTLPVVRPVGGLVDTVIDATSDNLESGTANGFVFEGEQAADLVATIERLVALFNDELSWKKMQMTAMWRDFSWDNSAREYKALYDQLG